MLSGADKHAPCFAICFGHEIQTVVHAINKIHIGVPGGSEDDAGGLGEASRRMRRKVSFAQVRFRFGDTPRRLAMHDYFAKQLTRNGDRIAFIELAGKNRSF